MDPIAIASSAVSILKGIKEDIDKAKLVVKEANLLLSVIEIFEVTICMIPTRGDENKKNEQENEKDPEDKLADIKEIAGNGLMELGSEFIPDALKDLTGFFGDAMEIFESEESLECPPIFSCLCGKSKEQTSAAVVTKISAAGTLELMREQGAGNVDISFAGMAFIIKGAIKVIKEAADACKKIENPNLLWFAMPWKVSAQIQLGEDLKKHFQAIKDYNIQLQSSVSIASYAVSLENLENTLNSSNAIKSIPVREFWKTRIGIDKTRVNQKEFSDAFLEEIGEQMEDLQKQRLHAHEHISGSNYEDNPDVALKRFLLHRLNPNGDDVITVYELNHVSRAFTQACMEASSSIISKSKSKTNDIMSSICDTIVELENSFVSEINFEILKDDSGDDGIEGTIDDRLESAFSDYVCLDPFHRLKVICTTPCFREELYPYDCICLLKYSRDPRKAKLSKQVILEELSERRTYIDPDTNEDFYGKDIPKWNAPLLLKGKELSPRYFKGVKNFEKVKMEDEEEVKVETDMYASAAEGVGGVYGTKTILYTPVMMKPGFYTIRYCLDELEVPDDMFAHSMPKKKLSLSSKSYYCNRNLGFSTEVKPEVLNFKNFTCEQVSKSSSAYYASQAALTCISDAHLDVLMRLIETELTESVRNVDLKRSDKWNTFKSELSKIPGISNSVEILTKVQGTEAIEMGKLCCPICRSRDYKYIKSKGIVVCADECSKDSEHKELTTFISYLKTTCFAKLDSTTGSTSISSIFYAEHLAYCTSVKNSLDGFLEKEEKYSWVALVGHYLSIRKLIIARDLANKVVAPLYTILEQGLADWQVHFVESAEKTETVGKARKSINPSTLDPAVIEQQEAKGFLECAAYCADKWVELDRLVKFLLPSDIAKKFESSYVFRPPFPNNYSNISEFAPDTSRDTLTVKKSSDDTKKAEKSDRASLPKSKVSFNENIELSPYPHSDSTNLDDFKCVNPILTNNSPQKSYVSISEFTALELKYIIDFDESSNGIDILPSELVKEYFMLKDVAFKLDILESIYLRNIKRLVKLEEHRKKSEQKVVNRMGGVSSSGTTALKKTLLDGLLSDIGAHVQANKVMAQKEFENVSKAFRKQLQAVCEEIVDRINSYLIYNFATLSEKLSQQHQQQQQQVTTEKQKIEKVSAFKCKRVIEEINAIKTRCLSGPPFFIPSEDSFRVEKSNLGVLIEVSDKLSMIWGERDNNPFTDDSANDDELEQEEEGKVDVKWRPKISSNYPYPRVNKLEITDANDLSKFCVMTHVPKRVMITKDKENKKNEQTTTDNVIIPREIGIFRSNTDTEEKSIFRADVETSTSYNPFLDFLKNEKGDVSCKFEALFDQLPLFVMFLDPVKSTKDDGFPLMCTDEIDPAAAASLPSKSTVNNLCIEVLKAENGSSRNPDFDGNDDDDSYEDDDDDENDEDYEDEDDNDMEEREFQVISPCHDHVLQKESRVPYYQGRYGCDICGQPGRGWVYRCGDCSFDVHPRCVHTDVGNIVIEEEGGEEADDEGNDDKDDQKEASDSEDDQSN